MHPHHEYLGIYGITKAIPYEFDLIRPFLDDVPNSASVSESLVSMARSVDAVDEVVLGDSIRLPGSDPRQIDKASTAALVEGIFVATPTAIG